MHTRALSIYMLLVSCRANIDLPQNLRATCTSVAGCPSGLVCAIGVGQCVRAQSDCIVERSGELVPGEDGLPCEDLGTRGICVLGLCGEPQCGDGVKSGEEQCDTTTFSFERDACRPGCLAAWLRAAAMA